MDLLVKIKGTVKDFIDACKRAVSESDTSARKIKENFSDASAGARAAGGAAGGAGGRLLGAANIAGMGTGAAAGMAGAAVANLAVKAYQEYTAELERNAQVAQDQAAQEERRAAVLEKTISQNENAARSLESFAGAGELSNVQTLECQKSIDKLNAAYSGLGLTVDDVRNKTEKYVEAQARVASENKQQRMDSMTTQINRMSEAIQRLQEQRKEADSFWGRLDPRGGGQSGVDAIDKQLDELRAKYVDLVKQRGELDRTDPAADVRAKAAAEAADAEAKAAAAAQKRAASVEEVISAEQRENEIQKMRLQGLERELAIRQAIEKAEKAKGEALTGEEAARVSAAAAERFDAAAEGRKKKLTEREERKYNQQIEILTLQQQGDNREAAIRRAVYAAKEQYGDAFDQSIEDMIRDREGKIFDLSNPQKPEAKTAKTPDEIALPQITNRLQRIGALGGPMTTGPDYNKKTANTASAILQELKVIASKEPATAGTGMFFI